MALLNLLISVSLDKLEPNHLLLSMCLLDGIDLLKFCCILVIIVLLWIFLLWGPSWQNYIQVFPYSQVLMKEISFKKYSLYSAAQESKNGLMDINWLQVLE